MKRRGDVELSGRENRVISTKLGENPRAALPYISLRHEVLTSRDKGFTRQALTRMLKEIIGAFILRSAVTVSTHLTARFIHIIHHS